LAVIPVRTDTVNSLVLLLRFNILAFLIPVLEALSSTDITPNRPQLRVGDSEFSATTRKVSEMTIMSIFEIIKIDTLVQDTEQIKITKSRYSQGPPVQTPLEIFQQMQSNPFPINPTDIILEYSTYALDIALIRKTILESGVPEFELNAVLPPDSSWIPVTEIVKFVLSKIIIPPDWRLQTLFAVLFPQHPLVDIHHVSRTDSIKLALVVHVILQLFKEPSERRYPQSNESWALSSPILVILLR